MNNILIFGSCVSRDPFGHNNDRAAHKFSILDYYARTSLASLATLPSFDIDVSTIPSPFQRRMVERDISKIFLDELGSYDFDILLVDFIDDRFNLLLLPEGRGITDSNEFRTAKIQFNQSEPKRLSFSDDSYRSLWLNGWTSLLESLKRVDKLDNLLINKVFWPRMTKMMPSFQISNLLEI